MKKPKSPTRKSRKTSRPTVIDATATELTEDGNTPDDVEPETDAVENAEAKTEEPETATEDTQDQPSEQPSGKGKLLAGGLAAALIAGVAGGGYLYHTYGNQFFSNTTQTADIGAIESQAIEAVGSAEAAKQDAQTALQQAKSATDKTASLEAAIKKLEAESTDQKGTAETIIALTARIDALEKTSADTAKSITDLKSALQTAAEAGQGAVQADINLKFDEINQKLSALEKTQADLSSKPADTPDLSGLEEQLATANNRIAELEKQISDLQSKQQSVAAAPAPVGPDPAVTKAAEELGTTITDGKPFKAQLDALIEQTGSSLPLDALSANAETGIKTAKQLQDQLSAVAGQFTTPTSNSDADQSSGIWNTLKTKAASVVKVRKVGQTNWPNRLSQAVAALNDTGVTAAADIISADNPPNMPDQVAAWLLEARKHIAVNDDMKKLPQILSDHATMSVQQ